MSLLFLQKNIRHIKRLKNIEKYNKKEYNFGMRIILIDKNKTVP